MLSACATAIRCRYLPIIAINPIRISERAVRVTWNSPRGPSAQMEFCRPASAPRLRAGSTTDQRGGAQDLLGRHYLKTEYSDWITSSRVT
jgi:hypothetical protein